jgi:hypothetical protein
VSNLRVIERLENMLRMALEITVFTDRDRLEEYIEDMLYDEYSEKPQEEYDRAIKAKVAELDPFWVKVIAIYATN